MIETTRTDGALPDLVVAANARGETAGARLPILVAPPAEKRIDFHFRPDGTAHAPSPSRGIQRLNASEHPMTDSGGT